MANEVLRNLTNFLKDNKQLIMTVTAVGGVVSTTFLAFQSGRKYQLVYDDLLSEIDPDWSNEERVRFLVENLWKDVAPAVVSSLATITLVVAAHKSHSNKYAALAGAYAAIDKTLANYKEAIYSGKKAEIEGIESRYADQVISGSEDAHNVIITGDGDSLVLDSLSGRYFKSSMTRIRNAENEINAAAINDGYASQNDFYDHIGLPQIGIGETLGWTTDKRMEVIFSSNIAPTGDPCLVLDYRRPPVRDFYKSRSY